MERDGVWIKVRAGMFAFLQQDEELIQLFSSYGVDVYKLEARLTINGFELFIPDPKLAVLFRMTFE